MNQDEKITILGAGLVGALLGLQLAQLGYKVAVYEKRHDPRSTQHYAGRSINLALSKRGLKALEAVGLADGIKEAVIPMHGRVVHLADGSINFQAYGKEGQYINSVSRSGLNMLLIEAAEKAGVEFFFSHKCEEVNVAEKVLVFQNPTEFKKHVDYDILLGADGAFSALRQEMQRLDRFNYSQEYIEYGYKELSIPPTASGDFAMEPNGLHIWPRGNYMLIALPNPDKSFTLTLFFPFEGKLSFASINTPEKALDFFKEQFPDALSLMPHGISEYFDNPTSSLVTVKCQPWVYEGHTALIGDAAHAIVPFYGQGMNAGFEDCFVLGQLVQQEKGDWTKVFGEFERLRKPDADAIAELALRNFVEMRDLVADPLFLLRKKIEQRIQTQFPDRWMPLYSMVTFSSLRYSEALHLGKAQDRVLQKILDDPNIFDEWEGLSLEKIVEDFEAIK